MYYSRIIQAILLCTRYILIVNCVVLTRCSTRTQHQNEGATFSSDTQHTPRASKKNIVDKTQWQPNDTYIPATHNSRSIPWTPPGLPKQSNTGPPRGCCKIPPVHCQERRTRIPSEVRIAPSLPDLCDDAIVWAERAGAVLRVISKLQQSVRQDIPGSVPSYWQDWYSPLGSLSFDRKIQRWLLAQNGPLVCLPHVKPVLLYQVSSTSGTSNARVDSLS